jgi:hypothetical protein
MLAVLLGSLWGSSVDPHGFVGSRFSRTAGFPICGLFAAFEFPFPFKVLAFPSDEIMSPALEVHVPSDVCSGVSFGRFKL